MAKCEMCGICCRIFYVPLTEEEFHSRKFILEFDYNKVKDFDFEEIENNGWNLLKRNSGGCVYLKDNRCMVHSSKPKYCREFNCKDPDANKSMVEEIEKAKNK